MWSIYVRYLYSFLVLCVSCIVFGSGFRFFCLLQFFYCWFLLTVSRAVEMRNGKERKKKEERREWEKQIHWLGGFLALLLKIDESRLLFFIFAHFATYLYICLLVGLIRCCALFLFLRIFSEYTFWRMLFCVYVYSEWKMYVVYKTYIEKSYMHACINDVSLWLALRTCMYVCTYVCMYSYSHLMTLTFVLRYM